MATALSYADFYFQFKSTGFGDCTQAAQCLVKKLNLPYSGSALPQFVAVVKEVRKEIVEKNPRNRLTPSEFESAFAGWLWQQRFFVESPETASVNVETACASPSISGTNQDSVVTNLLLAANEACVKKEEPSNPQESDPSLGVQSTLLNVCDSGANSIDSKDVEASSSASASFHVDVESTNQPLQRQNQLVGEVRGRGGESKGNGDCEATEHGGGGGGGIGAGGGDCEAQGPGDGSESGASTSAKEEVLDALSKIEGLEDESGMGDDGSDQYVLEKEWIKKLKNELKERVSGNKGKSKVKQKDIDSLLTKEERDKQKIEAKVLRQAEKERIRMEEKLKKQQEREKKREEAERLKREEKARNRLARMEKKEKKMAAEKAERLKRKQAKREKKEAKIMAAQQRKHQATEERHAEMRQSAVEGQEKTRAMTAALSGQVTMSNPEDATSCMLEMTVTMEPVHLEKSKKALEEEAKAQKEEAEAQKMKEQLKKDRDKRQEERWKKCEEDQAEPSKKRKVSTPPEVEDESWVMTWPMEGAYTTRRRTRSYAKSLHEIAPDLAADEESFWSDDDGMDVCWVAGNIDAKNDGKEKRKLRPRRQMPEMECDENGKYSCQAEGCESKFTTTTHALDHMQNRHQLHLYSCGDCEEKFKYEDQLSYHRDVVHACAQSESEFVCDICGFRFSDADNLSRHNTLEHMPGEIRCEFCEATFHHSEDRKNHVISEHADIVHPCKPCGKFFRQETAALGHLKAHHADQVISCKGCKRQFAVEKSMKFHVESVHYNLADWETPFKCDVVTCQLDFSSEENLDRHQMAKHKDTVGDKTWETRPDPVEVVCDTCGAQVSKFKLVNHMKKHVADGGPLTLSGGQDLTECQECGKLYVNIKKHLRDKHSGRTFKCPECDKVFQVPHSLQNHIRAIHQNKRFQCDKCDKSYAYPFDFANHIAAAHNNQSWHCHYCGKFFMRSSERNRHEKSVHGQKADDDDEETGRKLARENAASEAASVAKSAASSASEAALPQSTKKTGDKRRREWEESSHDEEEEDSEDEEEEEEEENEDGAGVVDSDEEDEEEEEDDENGDDGEEDTEAEEAVRQE